MGNALTAEQIELELADLPGWTYRGKALHAVYKLADGRQALDFIAAVGDAAEELNHHPDLDWRWNTVILAFTSHDAGGVVTSKDVSAARVIRDIAGKIPAAPETA